MNRFRILSSQCVILLIVIALGCNPKKESQIDNTIMNALGNKHRQDWVDLAEAFKSQMANDSTNAEAFIGYAEAQIILYIFGFDAREETIPKAKKAFEHAWKLDSMNSASYKTLGMLEFLDWDWEASKMAFEKSIALNPKNMDARHWYSLWLSAMGDFDEAMAQSDTIMTIDTNNQYRIGRGSLLYFARRNEELRDLMLEEVEANPEQAWGYDWLGMAYIELENFEKSLATYYKAFNLADGLAEVGGGLGHALGLAGEQEEAKKLADFYAETAASGRYVPAVQRAFIHIGLGEYDEAIALLEQAYNENSWFIIFMQVEPWLDPLRDDPRFQEIMDRMEFPS